MKCQQYYNEIREPILRTELPSSRVVRRRTERGKCAEVSRRRAHRCGCARSTRPIIRTFEGDSWSHAVTPDGTRLYIVGNDLGTAVWNLETGVREPGLPAFEDDVAITPDGKFLYVIQGARLFIHDRASGTRVREVILGGSAQRIAMSSDGIALITSGSHAGGPDDWVDFVR